MILLRFEFRAAPVRGALRRSPRRWALAMLVACLGGCAGYTDWRQGNSCSTMARSARAGADAGLQENPQRYRMKFIAERDRQCVS